MTTYYCSNMEEALRRAKKAGREAGCYFGGITLMSARRGFAVYRDGMVVAQYRYGEITHRLNVMMKSQNVDFGQPQGIFSIKARENEKLGALSSSPH